MDARRVERAGAQLDELKAQSMESIGLAAAAFATALVASRLLPELVAPVLAGGLAVAFLGVRALVRRSLLIDELAADGDTHTIADVRRLALRTASPEHRRTLAATLRYALGGSPYGTNARVEANRALLDELAAALEDDLLELDPAAAVALDHLLGDGSLYHETVPADELRSRLHRALNGFAERRAA